MLTQLAEAVTDIFVGVKLLSQLGGWGVGWVDQMGIRLISVYLELD